MEARLWDILFSMRRLLFFLTYLIPEKDIVLEVDLKLRQPSGMSQWVEELYI